MAPGGRYRRAALGLPAKPFNTHTDSRTRQEQAAAAAIDDSIRPIKRPLLAILLNAGGAQARQAVLVDRILPGEEFLDRQRIAAARLFERKKPAADRGYDFRLTANDPTFGSRRRQIGDGQRGTVRPDDILDPRAMGLGHRNSHELDTLRALDLTQRGLKFA